MSPSEAAPPMLVAEIDALHMRLGRVEEKADGTQEVLLVRVTTDTGLVGHGEAVSNATVARSIVTAPALRPSAMASPSRSSAPMPCSRRRAGSTCTTLALIRPKGAAIHAMAAVDTALWDILGQSRGLACHALWGTRRRRIPPYARLPRCVNSSPSFRRVRDSGAEES